MVQRFKRKIPVTSKVKGGKILRETPLTGKTKDGDVLTAKEERFCIAYVDTLGNGTQSALAAYETDVPNTAASIAKENLRKPHIIKRISELLADGPLNEAVVDSKLGFIVNQYEDLGVSLRAIETYNKLKGRYEETEKDININISWGKPEKSE